MTSAREEHKGSVVLMKKRRQPAIKRNSKCGSPHLQDPHVLTHHRRICQVYLCTQSLPAQLVARGTGWTVELSMEPMVLYHRLNLVGIHVQKLSRLIGPKLSKQTSPHLAMWHSSAPSSRSSTTPVFPSVAALLTGRTILNTGAS